MRRGLALLLLLLLAGVLLLLLPVRAPEDGPAPGREPGPARETVDVASEPEPPAAPKPAAGAAAREPAAAPAPGDPRPLYPRCLQALIDSEPGPEERAILAEILAGLAAADAARRRDAASSLGLARDPLRAKYGSRLPEGRRWRGTDLDPRDARAALRPLLRDPDGSVRAVTISALLRWDAGPRELPLFFALLEDGDGLVVAQAIRAVLALQDGRPSGAAEDRIAGVLRSATPEVAAWCLGALEGSVLGDVLLDRIIGFSRSDVADGRLRRAALKCLAADREKNRRILEELLRRMRTTEDASEKDLALEGLERHVPPELRPWVADELVRAVEAGDLYALAAIPRVGALGGRRHVAWLESWTDPEKMAGQYGPDEIPRAVAEAVRAIRARRK